MFKFLVWALLVLSATGFLMPVFATSGLGVFLDNRSSNNTNLSYTTQNHNLNFTRENTTVGAEDEVQNTLGNTTKSPQLDPNPNPPNMTQDTKFETQNKRT
jgi:hypothetical protein